MVNDWEALIMEGAALTENGVEATLVEFVGRERDSWGEAEEGDEGCYVIFKVGSRYFRKEGYESSYNEDDRDWSWGAITEVFPTVETKTVYREKD